MNEMQNNEEVTDVVVEAAAENNAEEMSAEAEAPVENLITDENEIERAVEALIFAAPKAISLKKIKGVLGSFKYSLENLDVVLQRLEERYKGRGFELAKVAGAYQFRSHISQADLLQKLLEDRPVRLSPSALEVLAIIGYKQPVTRSEIDAVRGTDSGHIVRGLLEKNLIRTEGHAETPGRPLLYGTTPYFLEVFSLNSLDDLPALEEFERELVASNGEDSEGTILSPEPGMEQAALFHDHASPLAANPDRGVFDETRDEDVEAADFGVQERAKENQA
jgi:segregation and condensation protein B